jgi:UPF0716 protein FxsA
MNVAIWLLLAVLALPAAEIVVFVIVGLWAGFGWALLGIVTGSLTGALMLRWGGGHVSRIRVVLGEQRLTALEADSAGTMFLFAGILLLVPGFITDAIGLALLIGPLRRAVAALILRKARARAARADGVVDLEPDEWRQVPQKKLNARRKPPPNL